MCISFYQLGVKLFEDRDHILNHNLNFVLFLFKKYLLLTLWIDILSNLWDIVRLKWEKDVLKSDVKLSKYHLIVLFWIENLMEAKTLLTF